MSTSDKISLYKIDNLDIDAECYINKILEDYHKQKEENKKQYRTKKYREIKLISNLYKEYFIKIFYYKRMYDHPWKAFLHDIIISEEITDWSVKNHDFIVFVYSKENNLYAFTCGAAYNVITEHIDDTFPIELAKRILDPKKINKRNERALTGNIYAIEQYYRNFQAVISDDIFGRISKEFRGIVKAEIIASPEFNEIFKDKKIIHCDIKSSFKLHRNLNFNQCIDLIIKLDMLYQKELTEDEEKFFGFFTNIKKISKKNNKETELLYHKIYEKLYDFFRNDEQLDFDFCHKNYDLYLNADEYSISKVKEKWENPESINFYLEKLKSHSKFKNINNLESFKDAIDRVNVMAKYHDEERFYTRGRFIEHIHGEIESDNKSYFLLDGNWYQVDSTFISTLNHRFKELLSTLLIDKAQSRMLPWDDITEGQYNEMYIGKENYIYGDKICVTNVELFDVMYYTENEIILYHIKNGFGTSIRDVCSQIRNAARRIEESRKSDYKDLEAFYDQTINYDRNHQNRVAAKKELEKIERNDFISMFKNKITYVLAFKDTAKSERVLNPNNADKFSSNIAKFELVMLNDFFKSYSNVAFKICQIYKK